MSGKVGCLIIHGFAGDIHDVLPLAQRLREDGYEVECPTLEGHGSSRRHLAKSNRQDWIRSAEEAYKRLSMRADTIVVIGFSMGGLLSFHIATTYPVKLLITLNTPYKYWDVKQAMRYLRTDFQTHCRRYLHGIGRIPVRSMFQFRLLLSETKSLLPQVSVPYVLFQAKQDDTVHAVSATLLADRVGTKTTQINWFEHSNHMLLHGPEKEEAIEEVIATIRKHCPS